MLRPYSKYADINLDIDKGDTLLGGKFKNSPMTVKDIGTDENGQPTVNDKKLLAVRIAKQMPGSKSGPQNMLDGNKTKHAANFANPKVMSAVKELAKNAGGLQKAVEGSETIQDMVSDPDTGEFSKDKMVGAAARTAMTSSVAEKAMDAVLDRPEGQMILNIMNNPALKQRYINKPMFNLPASALKDRDTERRFLSEKSRAAGTAADFYKNIAAAGQEDTVQRTGAELTRAALQELSTFGPLNEINPADILKVAQIKAGRVLTPAERRSIRDHAAAVNNEAYGTDALNVVYSRKPGGLPGQRSITALRKAAAMSEDRRTRAEMSAAASEQAGSILNKIMETQAPVSESAGPRINLKKFMDANKNKEASFMWNRYTKLAAETALDSLIGLTPPVHPKVRVLIRRNFDRDNGVAAYINDNYLRNWSTSTRPSERLKTMLMQAKFDMNREDLPPEIRNNSKMFS